MHAIISLPALQLQRIIQLKWASWLRYRLGFQNQRTWFCIRALWPLAFFLDHPILVHGNSHQILHNLDSNHLEKSNLLEDKFDTYLLLGPHSDCTWGVLFNLGHYLLNVHWVFYSSCIHCWSSRVMLSSYRGAMIESRCTRFIFIASHVFHGGPIKRDMTKALRSMGRKSQWIYT